MSKVKCRTLHAYQAQDQSQLSFPEGAIVTILKRDGKGVYLVGWGIGWKAIGGGGGGKKKGRAL